MGGVGVEDSPLQAHLSVSEGVFNALRHEPRLGCFAPVCQ